MDHFNGAAILYVKLPVTMNVVFLPGSKKNVALKGGGLHNLTVDDDVSVVLLHSTLWTLLTLD